MKMEPAVIYNRGEINQKIPYPIIVENFHKRLWGEGKRRYYSEFTESERQSIGSYLRLFKPWYLIKGTPEKATFAVRNLKLLNRACNFFASL